MRSTQPDTRGKPVIFTLMPPCEKAGGGRPEPHRGRVLQLLAEYETCFRRLIQAGADAGVFTVTSARLASYAVLDLGKGISAWYRETGEYSEDTLVWQYSEFALRLAGASP